MKKMVVLLIASLFLPAVVGAETIVKTKLEIGELVVGKYVARICGISCPDWTIIESLAEAARWGENALAFAGYELSQEEAWEHAAYPPKGFQKIVLTGYDLTAEQKFSCEVAPGEGNEIRVYEGEQLEFFTEEGNSAVLLPAVGEGIASEWNRWSVKYQVPEFHWPFKVVLDISHPGQGRTELHLVLTGRGPFEAADCVE